MTARSLTSPLAGDVLGVVVLAASLAAVHGVRTDLRGRERVDVAAQLSRAPVLHVAEPLAGDLEDLQLAKQTLNASRRADRRKVDDDLLRRVARVYEESGPPRHLAVQHAFGGGESTAWRYIRKARADGFLKERA